MVKISGKGWIIDVNGERKAVDIAAVDPQNGLYALRIQGDMNIEISDLQIGAVEIKNADTDDRLGVDANGSLQAAITDPAGSNQASVDANGSLQSVVIDPAGSNKLSIDSSGSLQSVVTDPAGSNQLSIDSSGSLQAAITDPAGSNQLSVDANGSLNSVIIDSGGSNQASVDANSSLQVQNRLFTVSTFYDLTAGATADNQSMPAGTRKVIIRTAVSGNVRIRIDGTDPTGSVGMLVNAAQPLEIENASITIVRFIRDSGEGSDIELFVQAFT